MSASTMLEFDMHMYIVAMANPLDSFRNITRLVESSDTMLSELKPA